MSGKRKRDYRTVLQEVLRILPSPPAVRSITLDFEQALWTVFRELLPNVSLQGCLFHRTQALWRKENWITGTMWPQSCWSLFMLPIRTNNDIEAWHHGLNSRANNRVHLPFYLLVELLLQKARLVSIQIRLVSDGKLSRIQRKKYRLLQSKIFKHWEDFNGNEISARRLLKLCSYLNGPATRT
ncbi:unnamed protein product [Pocillopora meandrina]|uniref:MULE transposase domain-containing protein n=1 Tax=Pocillopora meandrina TaxID=46732 RepID=A0AAU9X1V4_9CNID|nr:unnamed protein product [Pocillopora meandrina]